MTEMLLSHQMPTAVSAYLATRQHVAHWADSRGRWSASRRGDADGSRRAARLDADGGGPGPVWARPRAPTRDGGGGRGGSPTAWRPAASHCCCAARTAGVDAASARFLASRWLAAETAVAACGCTAAVTAWRVARPGWHAPVPVICCGNVTVGGAGKTTVALDVGARLAARAGPCISFCAAMAVRRRAAPRRCRRYRGRRRR